MRLGEKLRYLREVEGTLRGLGREMTQQEIVRAIKSELKQSFSQSYLSQIESGSRPHLTNSTRMLLARFFKVHPGYLVDDPEGFHTELMSDVRVGEDQLDLWLIGGAERFSRDPEVSRALLSLAMHEDSRKCLLLAGIHSGYAGPGGSPVPGPEIRDPTLAQRRKRPMSWETFYLFCFCVGFLCSLLSFLARFLALASAPAARDCTRIPRMAPAAGDRRRRPSISEPLRRFWRGSAAPDICSAAIPACGRCWRWVWRY